MRIIQGFLIFQTFSEARDDEADFIPPEKRFDFSKIGRHLEEDPDAPGMGKLSFQMQTLEQTAEQEKKLKDAMKYATPDQLKVLHAQHLKDFDMGQDLNLLESVDLQNLQITIKSHRCDQCRILAMDLSTEFWNLEE